MDNLDKALIPGDRLAIGPVVGFAGAEGRHAQSPAGARNSVASSGNLAVAFVGFFLGQLVNDRYAD